MYIHVEYRIAIEDISLYLHMLPCYRNKNVVMLIAGRVLVVALVR